MYVYVAIELLNHFITDNQMVVPYRLLFEWAHMVLYFKGIEEN